jgi:hypothetical protein
MNREKSTDELLEELFELLADQRCEASEEGRNSDPCDPELTERIDLLIAELLSRRETRA